MKKGKTKRLCREFPGVSVDGTPHFHAEGPGSISAGWGITIPQTEQQSKKKKKTFGGKHLCDPGVHKNSANRTEKALTIGKNG